MRLDPELLPADALFARLYREFRKRSLSVVPLEKVKTQAQIAPLLNVSRKRKLGEDLTITISGAEAVPDTDVRSPIQVLRALRALMLACTITGTAEVESKAVPGTGTPTCPRCSATWSGATRSFCHTRPP